MIEAILRSTTAGLLVLGILWLLRLGPARRRVLAARIGLLGVLFALTGVRWLLPSLEAPLVVAQSSTVVPPSEESSSVLPMALWILGALIAIVPLILGSMKLRRLWRMGTQVGNAAPWVKAKVGAVPTPLVFGFPGKILLPNEFSKWGPVDQRNAMEHELAHIRAKDPIWVVVFGVAAAIFWWHPIVRVLTNCHRRDIELAADQAVLSSGVEPADYAQTLLTLAKPRGLAFSCPAAGIGPLEDRIRGALGFAGIRHRLPVLLLPAALLAVGVGMVGFADRELVVRPAPTPTIAAKLPTVNVSVASRPRQEPSAVTLASSSRTSARRKPQYRRTATTIESAEPKAPTSQPDPIGATSPASQTAFPDPVSAKEPAASLPNADPFGTTSPVESFPKVDGRYGKTEGAFGGPRYGSLPSSTSRGSFQKNGGE